MLNEEKIASHLDNVKSKLPPKLVDLSRQLAPYLPALFFFFGFIFDIATLGRIDNIFNMVSHGLYLGLIIFIISNQIRGYEPRPDNRRPVLLFFEHQNELLHFLLGALLNAFIIFYFKSSSIVNSLSLLTVMGTLLIINELPLIKRQGPGLKVALLKISLISYFIYLVPILMGKTGTLIFLLSLLCSSLVIAAIYFFLQRAGTDPDRVNYSLLAPSIGVMFIFLLLYAGKVIPPVPLSLKQIGIYHKVERIENRYHLYRQTPDWKFWARGDQNFEARPGDRIYLFTRIFSPGGFKEKVYILFQRKDRKNRWQTTDRIPLNTVGGRAEGFRGYAYKKNYQAGKWRARVETANGLEIGRINFTITMADNSTDRELFEDIR